MNHSRRAFLATAAGAGAAHFLGARRAWSDAGHAMSAVEGSTLSLAASTTQHDLLHEGGVMTDVWCYNERVPGPPLTFHIGDKARIEVENRLPQPTSVHWHGLRVPNAMDGVPGLSGPPIAPGSRFTYEFDIRNSGTFWYHPHFQSAEQLARGLAGVVVVPEDDPPVVDRDIVWVLDDWRLEKTGQLSAGFDNRHDASHGGRLGNIATLNGRVPDDLVVKAGERLRLRLVNTANARIFALDFQAHAPQIIAYDGHAVAPHAPESGLVVLGPAMRVDVILDMRGEPDARYEVRDRAYRKPYTLLGLRYGSVALRASPPATPIVLPAPALPEPDLDNAERHVVEFTGGAMGGMASAKLNGELLGIRTLARRGKLWAVNGVVASGPDMVERMLSLKLDRSYILEFVNDTAFPHPVHLHGHPFRVLSRNGTTSERRPWRDTLLMASGERTEVAFVADNPGHWMLHCHIPEHLEAGMMGIVEVA